MLKLSAALRRAARPSQARHLHYDPTSPYRLREGLKEPQELGPYYKYRYSEYQAYEQFGELRYHHHEPYLLATFYDWENYLPTEYNEHWSYTSMWVYLVFGILPLWVFLYGFVREMDHERGKLMPIETKHIAEGLPYWGGISADYL